MAEFAEHDPLIALEDDPEHGSVHQPYSAFNQGFDAGEQGIPISLNPYPEESIWWHWWNDGHEHATDYSD